MTCREIADFLMQYIDGEFPWRERTAFKFHLALCPMCRGYSKSYERTVKIARSSKSTVDDPNPESVPDELVRAILKSHSHNPRSTVHIVNW